MKNTSKGITLIVLVITIIVLIILAGVTISILFGENGLITKAQESKIMQILGTVKEEIKLEQLENKIDNKNQTVEQMLAEGKIERAVQEKNEMYYLYYALKEDTYSGMQGLGKGSRVTLKDVFLIDDNFNLKYIDKNGKEYGDTIQEKILEDETEIRFSSEAFSKYISRISGVEEKDLKFKWMKNQTALTIDDPLITNLEDLVFFPNLITLNLGSWEMNGKLNLENLKGVGYCKNLKTLTGIYTTLDNFEGIEECKDLESIKFVWPSKSPDFSAIRFCKKLKSFSWSGNCDISGMFNSIKDITTLQNLTLDSINLTSMEELEKIKGDLITISLQSNKISKIEGIAKFSNLQTINLKGNDIEDITPLAKNTKLTSINLQDNPRIDANRQNYTGKRLEALNKIGEILDNGGTIYLDADKLQLFTNYTSADFVAQGLTSIEFLEGMTNLEYLSLRNNKLTLSDLKSQEILGSMKKLRHLNIAENNGITNISFVNNLDNLQVLEIYGNTQIDIKQIENKISSLSTINCSNETFLSIMNCSSNSITKLNIGSLSNLSVDIPKLSKFTNLTEVKLSDNPKITDFTNLSEITSLEKLTLVNCNLHGRMISFSKFNNLNTLDLSRNSLWSEDLVNLAALKNNTNLTIDLRNNSIIDATILLELDESTKIYLQNNVNLNQDSKDKLKAKFGSKVSF